MCHVQGKNLKSTSTKTTCKSCSSHLRSHPSASIYPYPASVFFVTAAVWDCGVPFGVPSAHDNGPPPHRGACPGNGRSFHSSKGPGVVCLDVSPRYRWHICVENRGFGFTRQPSAQNRLEFGMGDKEAARPFPGPTAWAGYHALNRNRGRTLLKSGRGEGCFPPQQPQFVSVPLFRRAHNL